VNDLRDDDVKSLLALALADGDAPLTGAHVDPAADVARGRRLLRRRRAVRFGGVATAAAACVVTSVALTAGGPVATTPAPTPPAVAGEEKPQGLPAIALVAYDGRQVPGYRVAEVPSGWEIQGGNAFALTIAPKDAADKSPDSFAGKLVVMLESQDAGAPEGPPDVSVDGRPGHVRVEGDTQVLTYQDVDGRWVVIQAPTSLGWDGERIARFATGVEVLGNAEGGRG
jgi:hypothetical protein